MDKYKFIKFFPKPFLEDLVNGKTIPIIGAGFSKNAEIPRNKTMLAWDELGKAIADEIEDYKYSNPLDAISAYCHEYSRTKLVESLTKLLLVNVVKPGKAHTAFCQLQFDIVCTTNFEFLLEDGYKLVNKYCRPIIDEEQLSISNYTEHVQLLKLHGDLHHPNRLIATEEDYDSFLVRYPLLSTYLANLLISRTPLFIGYSLDDTDFRQIWQLIKDRLGSLRRQAYVLKVSCSSHEKARFERRGVKVIDIKGNPAEYPSILEEVFKELKDYWTNSYLEKNIISEDNTMAELALPEDVINRLCFFSIPVKLLPFYKKYVFPIVKRLGLIPISADDVVSIGDNWVAKITALINRAEFIVVDIATQNTYFELGIALSNKDKKNRILIIKEEDSPLPADIQGYLYISRPSEVYQEPEYFVESISNWFREALEPLKNNYFEEPERLLAKKEYRAAVIASISLLENYIRERLSDYPNLVKSNKSLYTLIQLAIEYQIISSDEMGHLKEWMYIRNNAVHTNSKVSYQEATKIVKGVKNILKQ
ncbi:MAG: SIR2 family protein [Salinivirgaceae bacterium]